MNREELAAMRRKMQRARRIERIKDNGIAFLIVAGIIVAVATLYVMNHGHYSSCYYK